MDCRHCGLRIERLPETCSEIKYVHSTKVNGAKFAACAYASPSVHHLFYDQKVGYLTAEPASECSDCGSTGHNTGSNTCSGPNEQDGTAVTA